MVSNLLIGILTLPSTNATKGIMTLPSHLENITSDSGQYLTSISLGILYTLLKLANLLGVSTIDLNFLIILIYCQVEWVKEKGIKDLQTRKSGDVILRIAWRWLERLLVGRRKKLEKELKEKVKKNLEKNQICELRNWPELPLYIEEEGAGNGQKATLGFPCLFHFPKLQSNRS